MKPKGDPKKFRTEKARGRENFSLVCEEPDAVGRDPGSLNTNVFLETAMGYEQAILSNLSFIQDTYCSYQQSLHAALISC